MPEWAAKIHMCVRALLNEGETRKTTKGEEGKEGKRKGKDSISGAEEGGGEDLLKAILFTVCA